MNYVMYHVLRVALEVPVCCTPNVLKENSKFAFLSLGERKICQKS